jgi:CheY-like chemotaxis protein
MVTHDGYVLVVEDDPAIRQSLVDLLEGELGHSVMEAPNGLVALQVLTVEPRASLVLLDMSMPVMDGETFIRMKNAEPLWAEIPVCVMSADRIRWKELPGVGAYLWKPFEESALMTLIRQHCGAGRAR